MKPTKIPTAIAGLGCQFPDCPDTESLASWLRRGRQGAGTLPRGADGSAAGALRLALIGAAREALRNALGEDPHSALKDSEARFAVFFILDEGTPAPDEGTLGEIAIAAGLASRHLLAVMPVLSVMNALERARTMLERAGASAVLILSGSVRGDSETQTGTAVPFSMAGEKSLPPPPPSEGATALVLVREGSHSPQGVPWPIHARIAASAIAAEPGARGIEQAFARLFAAADWRASAIGLIGVIGRRDTAVAEVTAISRVYKEGPRETVLSAVRANLGDAGAATSLAALLGSALCLDHAMVPPVPGWASPGPAILRDAGGLYVAEESRVWMTRPGAPLRRAVVVLPDPQGSFALVGLEAGPDMAPVAVTAATLDAPLLFPIAGLDAQGLEAGLAALEAGLAGDIPMAVLSRQAQAESAEKRTYPRALALVAANPRELTREIGFMRKGLQKGAATGKSIRTPSGSVYAPIPVAGPGTRVAFVYPGSGTGYPGLGREVLLSFARHVALIEPRLARRLSALLCADLVYPKAIEKLAEEELKAVAAMLNANMMGLLQVGVAFGVAYSHILRASFGVNPDMAFGYSVGELTMRIALGQFKDWGTLEAKLGSPCLTANLTGEMKTVREFWAARGRAPGRGLWAAHVVKTGADPVRAAMEGLADVFLTTINTPDEVVIAGAPEACAALLARLGALSMPLEFSVAIHAPPAELEEERLRSICDNPVDPVQGVEFYSAYSAAPVPQKREAIAAITARMLQNTVDFPRLIERAYGDGARVFIETGVRNNCTNWVNATLGERPHLAVPLDIKGLPSDVAWMRALAVLFANRVPLDFTELSDTGFRPPAEQVLDLLVQERS
jgi:PfaB family protein